MRKKRLISTKETEIRLKSHQLELERINSGDLTARGLGGHKKTEF